MYDAGAGKLDRRIVIQKPELVDDGFTQKTQFTDWRTVWAGVSWISDAQKWLAGGSNRSSVVRFVIRSSADTRLIDTTYRIQFENKVYIIDGFKPYKDARTHLELTCSLGVK
ncbi:phage head closure protein [Ketogulonicigenium vulgare]|uniref:phage head closure protein n=1 Tax=Ketogulonicigenium vulgare TaxID=92945 RepID=UPI00235871D9|nr:phage head closure protein [Ketogulonicigenium vulgare]